MRTTEKPESALITQPIAWRFVDDEMPDDEIRVLVAFDDDDTGEPSFGYHSGGVWYFDDFDGASRDPRPVYAPVYAWAHTPGLPPKKGGAS